jgi:threonine/homoserine/homoserine lactone efflux protein
VASRVATRDDSVVIAVVDSGGVVSLAAAGGIALTALGMVLTPGPNMVYLVSRSVSQGRAAGMISLAGTAVGFLLYMTMANLGLAVVFVAVPWLYIGLKVAGVLYLAYLAWQALKPGGHGPFDLRPLHPDSSATLFRVGLLTNLLNPKTAVMYLALIPQFIDPSRSGTIAQGFTLGAIQIVMSIAVNALIILGAGSIAAFLSQRPSWTKWQRRLTGSMLATVALLLAREIPERAQI